MPEFVDDAIATFSIVGHDPVAEEWGVAVQSKFLAVGAYVPFARAGAGAIATQSWCNTSYGPKGLDLLAGGLDAQTTLDTLISEDPGREFRQVGIVDAQGGRATFTGKECLDWAGGELGVGCAVQGNILTGPDTVTALRTTFEQTEGPLGDRLLAALAAGQVAGGDRRGKEAAALLVVREGGGYGGFNDRLVDLRVDDHPEPIEELQRIFALQKLYFGRTRPGNLVPLVGDTLTEVVGHLVRLGYLAPDHPTVFDTGLQEAMTTYYLTENFDDRAREDAQLDREVLDFMRGQQAKPS